MQEAVTDSREVAEHAAGSSVKAMAAVQSAPGTAASHMPCTWHESLLLLKCISACAVAQFWCTLHDVCLTGFWNMCRRLVSHHWWLKRGPHGLARQLPHEQLLSG